MAFTLRKRTSVVILTSFRLDAVWLSVWGDSVFPHFRPIESDKIPSQVESDKIPSQEFLSMMRLMTARAMRLADTAVNKASEIPSGISDKTRKMLAILWI